MAYVVTLHPKPEIPDDARAAQREALKRLTQAGTLVLVGRFADGDGGMVVLKAGSLDEARESYQQTPLAAGGFITWTIREWEVTGGSALDLVGS